MPHSDWGSQVMENSRSQNDLQSWKATKPGYILQTDLSTTYKLEALKKVTIENDETAYRSSRLDLIATNWA